MVLDQLAAYCERAQEKGVVEIALTEHLHRFTQLDAVVGKFWEGEGFHVVGGPFPGGKRVFVEPAERGPDVGACRSAGNERANDA